MPYRLNVFTGELDQIALASTTGGITQIDSDSGSVLPVAGVINILGGTGVDTSGASNTLTISVDLTEEPTIATGFVTDSGTAIAVSNSLNIIGGTGASTSASGDTITITASTATALDFVTDSGTATPAANMLTLSGSTHISTAGSGAVVTYDLTDNTNRTAVESWNGSILETAPATVTSDGATIILSIEKDGGGDLTVVFSDGYYTWDTTPAATVTLTAGTDVSPQLNYIYLLQSNKTLTNSTAGFPMAEHAPIAVALCQSAASLQTQGPYKMHVWEDHTDTSNEQGHISHINGWIRKQQATYETGVAQTYTITTNGGAADNVTINTTAGVILRLHDHDFPAFTAGHDYYVINDSGAAYTVVTDLNALLTDSTGASMSGRFFSLVMWGAVNEDAGDCKIFINLPGGSYNNATGVLNDDAGYANFTIPSEYTGVGFLISQFDLRHQAASSGTWTSIAELDLRGLIPSKNAGGLPLVADEFPDDLFRIFDDGDSSKKIAFQASGITTSTVRTITMVDADLDLAQVPTAVVTDSGTATPAANSFSIVGGTGISTSGATSVVTITNDGVLSPGAVTDDAVVRWDGTSGTAVQNSVVTITDAGVISGITQLNVDNLRLDGNDISSTDTNGNITLTPDGTGIVSTMSALSVGGVAETDITIGGVAIDGTIIAHTEGATDLAEVMIERHSDTAGFGGHVIFSRSRGTEASETVVQDGDVLSQMVSVGHDGTDYELAANIRVEVDGTPGAGDMPGRIVFLTTPDGAATPVEGMRLSQDATLTLANALPVSSGGTLNTTFTAYSVLCAGTTATGAFQNVSGVGTAAQVLTSNGAAALPTWQAAAGGGLTWNEVTGTSQAAAVENGYICNNVSLVTVTIPTTAAVGETVRIAGSGAGGWKVAQNASEIINFGSTASTTGVTGSLASTNRYDAVELLCIVANTEWVVLSSLGNITVA